MSKVLKRLDVTHQKLLDQIAPLSEAEFSRSPAEGAWCVAEIVHHLTLVEERVTEELVQALEREPRKLNPLRRFIPTSIVASRLIRVKAPKAVVPASGRGKEASIAAFNAARSKLKHLYEEHGESRLKRTIFKHPFLGEINGIATISFIAYHEQRHSKQIREVLKNLSDKL